MNELRGQAQTTASDALGPAGATRSLVRMLEGAGLPARTRILSLGTRVAPLAELLRSLGHEVVEPRSDEPRSGEEALAGIAESSPGSFDAVLALGFVERLRWDRWALQQIHRALKGGGVLLLAVPDLYSLRSLADPRYVASKLAKVLGGGRPQASGRDPLRSYPSGRLRAMLDRLGYDPLRWSGLAIRGSDGLSEAWPATHHLVLARKRPESPDPASAADGVRRFEAENRAFLALRETWRRELALPSGAPRPLEPGRYAGAHVLVLAPHPDDEIIGCGGTLLTLVRAGAKVTVLQATDGSASAALEDAAPDLRRTIRLDEARAVAEAAGFEPTLFWNEDNGAFRLRDDLVARLGDTIRELRPALIFSPFLADVHPDHRTLNRILAGALEGAPGNGTSVAGYEVWSLAPANLWCDVSSRMPDVERLLRLYRTAMKVDDFIHMCRIRNHAHARTLGGGTGYAEAFFACDAARFRELIGRLAPGAPSGSAPSGQ